MNKRLNVLIGVLMICSISCANGSLEKKKIHITKTDGSIVNIEVEIARTEEEKNFGYMEREHIPEGTGMIFIFERDQIMNFWMKDTPTALSIAYIDSRGTIREMYDLTPFSLASVTGTVSCRYALEVPQGWFKKNGIHVGSTIDVEAILP